jgi:hypothetical protein
MMLESCELTKLSAIASDTTGTVNAAPIQKRRVISVSSGLSSSTETVMGSNAMPHNGHVPGVSWTICGCMGQVYFTLDR